MKYDRAILLLKAEVKASRRTTFCLAYPDKCAESIADLESAIQLLTEAQKAEVTNAE